MVNAGLSENTGSIDTSVPNMARVYDFLLGGGHNFLVDRELATQILKKAPYIGDAARVNRSFLRRAVVFMLDNGIRQFLDIGSGIPTVGNVHEIAQRADPACRVVYVDKEPIAVEHSRMLLRENDQAVAVLADIRDPDDLLAQPEIGRILDFSQPVGLLNVAVWHFVSDADDPAGLMARYRAVLAPGSYLALAHLTRDSVSRAMTHQMIDHLGNSISDNIFPRTHGQVMELFAGFDVVPPGVVAVAAWRPDGPGDFSDDHDINTISHAGVGRVA
jgi:SAM-dependent methyltransferase